MTPTARAHAALTQLPAEDLMALSEEGVTLVAIALESTQPREPWWRRAVARWAR